MSDAQASSGAPLAPGTIIGSRFRVDAPHGNDLAGTLYRATDTQAQRPVLLRIFPSVLLGDEEERKVLREWVKKASQVAHPGLASIYGMGKHEDTLYVAGEFVEGLSLADHIARRKPTGKYFPLVGLQKAFGPLVAAVAHAHAQGSLHGLVATSWVQVTDQGRVALRGLGFLAYLLGRPGFAQRLSQAGYAVAPELIRDPSALSSRADVYGLGALFYELLTNQPVPTPYVPPSQLRPDLPKEFDAVLSRCLVPDPNARIQDVAALVQALTPIFAKAAAPKAAPVPLAPGLPPPPRQNPEDEERWLLQRQGLDYGPFTARQLKKQLEEGEISEDSTVLDCDTSQRRPIGEHDYFRAFVDDWRKNVAKRTALKESAAVERSMRGANKNRFAIIAGVVLLVAGAVAAYLFLVPRVRDQNEVYALLAVDIVPKLEDDLYWVTKPGRVPKPKKRRPQAGQGGQGGPRVPGAPGAPSGPAGPDGGYDDDASNNISFDFGDDDTGDGPSENGGIRPVVKDMLTGADIERGMKSVNGGLSACVRDEKRRSGESSFGISFIIKSDGSPRGIRVTTPGFGGSPLEKCIKGAVSRARFPASSGETPASYSFGL